MMQRILNGRNGLHKAFSSKLSKEISVINSSLTGCRYSKKVGSGAPPAPVSMTYSSFQPTPSVSTDDPPPVVIMHGLLGSKNNWKSLAKVISQKSGRLVYTVDARNHGDSPHTQEFSYYAMAEDLIHFLKERSLTKACFMGHSMGGRAAMAAALLYPDVIEKLFVYDISPFGSSDSISTLSRIVEMMRKIDIPLELSLQQGRKFADQQLINFVPEMGIRQFILSNLMKTDEGFSWKANVVSIAKNFNPHISTFPLKNLGLKLEKPTFFVGGALSNYIRKEDHSAIIDLFPESKFFYLEGAGHWLHADKPQDFLNLILPLLK